MSKALPSTPELPSMRSYFACHAVAPENMFGTFVDAGVDQPVMSWSKASALANMVGIFVTLAMFQPASGWLKIVAP